MSTSGSKNPLYRPFLIGSMTQEVKEVKEVKEIKEIKEIKEMLCSSCGKRIEAERFWVKFPCPNCRKEDIIRCEKCKTRENKYACSICKFEGP